MADKNSIDAETLLAIAKALKAKGKIDKIDMESQAFIDFLKNEAKEFGKVFGDELGAWGDTFKDLLF